MSESPAQLAAQILWKAWRDRARLDSLPEPLRPATRRQAYRIQEEIAHISGQPIRGWKIAATSAAGQQHIGVDGPLAGRLLGHTVTTSPAALSLRGTHMRVAEAEFCFQLGRDFPPRGTPYTQAEVLEAVTALFLAIEVPDSRYRDFTSAGALQLIADNACALWFTLGAVPVANWRDIDFPKHQVRLVKNDSEATEGVGANVLGDPRAALAWLVNEVAEHDAGVTAEQIVTTGTCVPPIAVSPGDSVRADFGTLGAVEVRLNDDASG